MGPTRSSRTRSCCFNEYGDVMTEEEYKKEVEKLTDALNHANDLMEKLINGDKFHMEYLLKTQTMADKALGRN